MLFLTPDNDFAGKEQVISLIQFVEILILVLMLTASCVCPFGFAP